MKERVNVKSFCWVSVKKFQCNCKQTQDLKIVRRKGDGLGLETVEKGLIEQSYGLTQQTD